MDYSVLMSVYCQENAFYFEKSLESMFQQTVPFHDLVLVCDGVLNEALDNVINKYKDLYEDRLTVIPLQENVGLGKALSIGLPYCKSSWVARMDTDDIALPDRIEKQIDAVNKNIGVSVVGGQIQEFIESENNTIAKRVVPLSHSNIIKFSQSRNPMNHVTVFFNKDDVMACGNYQNFYFMEDYYLWIRMLASNYTMMNLPDVLVKVRISKETYSRRGGLKYFKNIKKLF